MKFPSNQQLNPYLWRISCLLCVLGVSACGTKHSFEKGLRPNSSGATEQVATIAVGVPLPEGYEVVRVERGMASWYGGKFHGRKTASGERYNKYAMTAAHKKLPFGTLVRVTRELNGKQTIVRINDRGPFIRGRIIDLSKKAAGELDMIHDGIGKVRVEVLKPIQPVDTTQP